MRNINIKINIIIIITIKVQFISHYLQKKVDFRLKTLD